VVNGVPPKGLRSKCPQLVYSIVTGKPVKWVADRTERTLRDAWSEAGGKLIGVISTLDVMGAVREAKIDLPIAEIMSKPLFSIEAKQPLSAAVERLEHARVTGLVVLEEGYPVGVFTQLEAMESRDLARDTPVNEVFDPSMLCLPSTTKVYRAAEQATRMHVRRIIPSRDREAIGIITSFDFVKLAAKG